MLKVFTKCQLFNWFAPILNFPMRCPYFIWILDHANEICHPIELSILDSMEPSTPSKDVLLKSGYHNKV